MTTSRERVDPLQYLAKTAGNLASFARRAIPMGQQAAPHPVASTAGPAGGGQPPKSFMGGQTLERMAMDLYALGGVLRPEKKGGVADGSCPFAGVAAATASSEKTATWQSTVAGWGRQGANYFGRGARATGNFARSMVRPAERGAANNLRNMTAWQHARQLPMMAGGAVLGNMTAGDLGGPATAGQFEADLPIFGRTTINPAGMLSGMFMGHRGFRATQAGQTLRRPFMQAGAGSLAGSLVDTGAGLANVDTHGMGGRLGAWAGLGTGFGGNRVFNRRDAINNAVRRRLATVGGDAGLRQGVINAGRQQMGQLMNSPMARANQFLTHALEGSIDPFRGGWRRLRGHLSGQAMPNTVMRSAGGTQTFGRRAGQYAMGIPLGVTAAGLGYNALTGRLRDDANQQFAQMYGAGREQLMSDLDDYMHARGMLDQQGHFNPMQGAGHQLMQAANPFLQMLGFHNPQQMSGGQRLAGMTGPAMAGMGLMSGNPLLTGLGAGMYAYPHLAQGRGQSPQPHPLAAMVPGAPGFTGLDRNEFTHQSRHSAAQPSGQGWL